MDAESDLEPIPVAAWRRRRQLGPPRRRRGPGSRRARSRGGDARRPRPSRRLVERSAGGAGGAATETPSGRAEPVALAGDHDRVRVLDGDVEGAVPRPVDAHGRAQQPIEQRVDARVGSDVHVTSDRLADRRRWRPAQRAAECEHRAGRALPTTGSRAHARAAIGLSTTTAPSASATAASNAASQPGSTSTTSSNVPTHAVEIGEVLGAGSLAGLVEREVERLGPGGPAMVLRGGVHVGALGRGHATSIVSQLGVGARHGCCHRLARRLGLGALSPEAVALLGQARSTSTRAATTWRFEPAVVGRRAFDRVEQRRQLGAHLGGLAGRGVHAVAPVRARTVHATSRARPRRVRAPPGRGRGIGPRPRPRRARRGAVPIRPRATRRRPRRRTRHASARPRDDARPAAPPGHAPARGATRSGPARRRTRGRRARRAGPRPR